MNKWFKSLIIASVIFLSVNASAAMVTINGTDVSFTFDDASLYGNGMVVGNSLFFQPVSFSVESNNGDPLDFMSETLNIIVNSITDGYTITEVAMAEQGDYILSGAGASVAAAGRLGVTSNTSNCTLFPCNDSSIFNVAGLVDTGGALAAWSGGTSVDLGDTAGWGSDTDLSVSFQNDLTANSSSGGEQAFIQKKFGAIGIIINPVPVPAAVWLFGSGLLGLVGLARRKKT